jgi:hypothetical protein
MKKLLAGGMAALLPWSALWAQEGKQTLTGWPPSSGIVQCAGQEAVKVVEVPKPAPASPGAAILLHGRHGQVTPVRQGFHHTGGGVIVISQPSSDTLVVTMTGVAVAGGHPCHDSAAALDFDLSQCFEVTLEKGKTAKLTVEARALGLLRSHHRGSAEESGARATVSCGPVEVATVNVPAHTVAGGNNLSVNDLGRPITVPITAGEYTLQQVFHVAAHHPRCLCGKAGSAEFAPDPALDPKWISYWEPFHGAGKKDFGFQVTLKVVAE